MDTYLSDACVGHTLAVLGRALQLAAARGSLRKVLERVGYDAEFRAVAGPSTATFRHLCVAWAALEGVTAEAAEARWRAHVDEHSALSDLRREGA